METRGRGVCRGWNVYNDDDEEEEEEDDDDEEDKIGIALGMWFSGCSSGPEDLSLLPSIHVR